MYNIRVLGKSINFIISCRFQSVEIVSECWRQTRTTKERDKWHTVDTKSDLDMNDCMDRMLSQHYGDVILSSTASQITSLAIVCSDVYSGADQRKHQSSASLAFERRIHRGPVNSPYKWPVTRKMVPYLMTSSWIYYTLVCNSFDSRYTVRYIDIRIGNNQDKCWCLNQTVIESFAIPHHNSIICEAYNLGFLSSFLFDI